ncbi:MAG: DUF1565 domain-containing protein [Acidobacteria bacterium]|nr:MAG: DUF1565 domain-containing protein [Acidobacteriota bacterium]
MINQLSPALCLLFSLFCPSAIGQSGPAPRGEEVNVTEYRVVYYVSPSATVEGNGSREKPWRSLDQALATVPRASSASRYAVFVSQGTAAGDTIRMKEYVDLFGGFSSTDWKRDLTRYPTVLSGGNGRRVLIGANHAILNGFTVRAGQVRGKGAGLLCEGTSPIIRNNVFVENTTLAPANWAPKNLHEISNDGGAIYAANHAAPVIEQNLFVRNSTESGRGAGIAFHGRCKGRIAGNVFLDNVSGTKDPMRSSDGAAVSVFDWSSPVIENNLFIGNRALASNDAGGLFIALWSAPNVVGNVFLGNDAGDDAGGLFFGGQEHRYDRALDPLPDAKSFFVVIDRNYFAGNINSAHNSGALRFTMEGRVRFSNNVCLENEGVYFQRSEVEIVHNTILDAFRMVETKEGLGPSKLVNNIIWAPVVIEAPVLVSFCNLMEAREGEGNISRLPELVKDAVSLRVESVTYHADLFTTSLTVVGNSDPTHLVGRAVQSQGKWSVVRSVNGDEITVWGDFNGSRELRLLPTGHLAANSPGIDGGATVKSVPHDMDGQKRPQGKAPDIGADEVR